MYTSVFIHIHVLLQIIYKYEDCPEINDNSSLMINYNGNKSPLSHITYNVI